MKLAIFDIDGTLLRSHGMGNKAYLGAFHQELGIGPINTNWHEYNSSTDSGIYDEIFEAHYGRRGTSEEYERLRSRYFSIFRDLCSQRSDPVVLVPGAMRFMEALRASGQWAIGIASGNWRTIGEYKLQLGGIEHRVPSGYADDGVERHDLIETAHQRAKELHQRTSFDKVVYIGDGPWDVKACKRLNLPFLGVRDDGLHDSLKSRGAHNVITNYADHSHALEMLESATPPM